MKKLSSMIKSKKPLVIPGVYDAIGAIWFQNLSRCS